MKEHFAHSGAWGLAIIMIVVASWLIYRYLAPRNWREWVGTGVVQAFIIAPFGEGVVHWPTFFSVGLFPVIVIVYYLLARREERAVLAKFGDEYRAYMNQVPMFIPHRGQWRRLIHASSP